MPEIVTPTLASAPDGPAQLALLATRVVDVLTRAERVALTGGDLWDGRVVFDTDWDEWMGYSAGRTRWEFIGNTITVSTGAATAIGATPTGLLNTTDIYTGLTICNRNTADPIAFRQWVVMDASPATYRIVTTSQRIACGVRRAAAKSINNNAVTAVDFDTEVEDTDAFHDNVTNNTRLAVPTGLAGHYSVKGFAQWAAAPSATNSVILRLNGTTALDRDWAPNIAFATASVNKDLFMNVGDYVELLVYQVSGAAINVAAAAANANDPTTPFLELTRTGP